MRILVCLLALVILPFSACELRRSSQVVLQPQKTGITTLKFYDEGRARPLITEIWYPVEQSAPAEPVAGLWVRCPEARDAPLVTKPGKQYPLIVMSHGNGGDRLNNAWIAEILASNGYIVAAMDHHGNTWNNKIAEGFVKIWERPQDVSFVIDQLLQSPQFGSHINPQKIGFIGYSLGGHTGVWIAGGKVSHFDKPDLNEIPADQLPNIVTPEFINGVDFSPAHASYRDARVAAVFLMAPALAGLFDPASLQAIQIPVHIVASEGDITVPVEGNAKILAGKIKKVAFKLIPGAANHYVFLNEVTKGGKMMLDRSVSIDHPSVNRKEVHEEIGLSAVEFFNTTLHN
jgi:predicted dienelactone hydrolase